MRKTIEQYVNIAEELAKNNNGILPNPSWLRKNGYNVLNKIMYKYKDKFAHIKQVNFKKKEKQCQN